jgi:hypothetical protein
MTETVGHPICGGPLRADRPRQHGPGRADLPPSTLEKAAKAELRRWLDRV